MINNPVYRTSLEKAIPDIAIQDGKILVTGASGLIGSCLTDLLLLANSRGRKFEIYALGRDSGKLAKRFAYCSDPNRLRFIEQDIRKPLEDDVEYDYIIHGASNASPDMIVKEPVETMLSNIVGLKDLFDSAKNNKTKK